MNLYIRILGGFAATIQGEDIPPEKWRLRRASSLVKLLALSPSHRLQRDRVIDALWPDADLTTATNNFHQVLHAARQAFGPHGKTCLSLNGGILSLSSGDGRMPVVDVDQFEDAARFARDSQAPEAYRQALALYSGDLLPDDIYEEWTLSARESVRSTYLGLLVELSDLYEKRQELPEAVETLKRVLASDPAHEQAHTKLMRLYALSGQHQQSLRQYQTLVEVMQAELDAEPGPVARQLFEAIRAGEVSAPVGEVKQPKTTPSNNLPAQLTSFIGRERAIEEITHMLADHRLVTLTGSGGTGKTRLAIQVAGKMLDHFSHGVWLVDLVPINDPELLPHAMARILGLKPSGETPVDAMLANHLREKELLLVLDNCEHLLDACARLAHSLLQAAPGLVVLTTGREPLGIIGEVIYRVPSLSLPGPDQTPSIDELDRYEALQLFYERARMTSPDIVLSANDVLHLTRICRRLDGIPLAVELAAARVGPLGIPQIADRLDDRFRLLTGGSRTAMPRQRTLQASIDWSYSLLSPEERTLLNRLSVFSGGWKIDAAESICSGEGLERGDVIDLISSLVNKSMVIVSTDPSGQQRYNLLETIRQYAQEKWADAGDPFPLNDRHLDYFLDLSTKMKRQIHSPGIIQALKTLDSELDNLRSAMGWAFSQSGSPIVEAGLRLAISLEDYWEIREIWIEGTRWLQHGLEQYRAEGTDAVNLRADAYFLTGVLNPVGKGHDAVLKSIDLYRQTANKTGLARALCRYAYIEERVPRSPTDSLPDRHRSTAALIQESLEAARAQEDPLALVEVLMFNANSNRASSDGLRSLEYLREALAVSQAAGDPLNEFHAILLMAVVLSQSRDGAEFTMFAARSMELAVKLDEILDDADLSFLGFLAYMEKDYPRMEAYYQRSIDATQASNLIYRLVWARRLRAMANLRRGRLQPALMDYQKSLSLSLDHDDPMGILLALVGLAGVATHTCQVETASRLLGFVNLQIERWGRDIKAADVIEFPIFRWTLALLEKQVDQTTLSELWNQGQALTLDQAVSIASSIQIR